MKAIVLCAGYGTRLGGMTKNIPKPMLPLNGKPLLDYTLRYLANQKITDIAINLHFSSKQITDYFRDGKDQGVSVTYFHEKKLLGTAGAVKNMSNWIEGSEHFLVIYGDLLINQNLKDMLEFHQKNSALATLLLHQRKASNSLVNVDGHYRIIDFIERPTEKQKQIFPYPWVNSGVAVFHSRVLKFIPDEYPSDLPGDVYCKIVKKEKTVGFPLSGYRCAIDSPERYRQAELDIQSGKYSLFETGD